MARIRSAHRTEQLEKILEARLRQGQYVEKSRMPAERELSEELKFSRHTVRKSLQSLHHRGLLQHGGRGYFVSDHLAALVWPRPVARHQFAIFAHMGRLDHRLLAEVEEELRRVKAVPLTFNLESMDLGGSRADVLSYLHVKVDGALFLNSVCGEKAEPIPRHIFDSLPMPYAVVGEEPEFECGRFVGVDPLVLADKTVHFLVDRRPRQVELAMPWPLQRLEAQFLHHLSVLADKVSMARRFKIRFENPGLSSPPSAAEATLLLLHRRLYERYRGQEFKGEVLFLGPALDPRFACVHAAEAEQAKMAVDIVVGKKKTPAEKLLVAPKLQLSEIGKS